MTMSSSDTTFVETEVGWMRKAWPEQDILHLLLVDSLCCIIAAQELGEPSG